MNFRSLLIASAAMIGLSAAGHATADNINFSQFGVDGTSLSSPITGLTTDGVSFTMVGPSTFTRYDQGTDWHGNFYDKTALLFDGVNPGQVVIYFATPLSSLNSIAAEANLLGLYTATLNGYSGGVLVTSSSYSSDSEIGGTGATIGFAISGYFDTVTISTTHDGEGFAIGGVAPKTMPGVPEPASWALMLVGVGMAGASLRRRARAVAA